MMDKNFLIIDGVLIPDMESESLKIYRKDLDVYVRMVNGRLVCEKRGYYWVVEADFSDISNELLKQLDAVLFVNKSHMITFLPSTGLTDTVTAEFYMTTGPEPNLKSWMEEVPEWSNFAYKFEEVRPHD